MKPKHANVTADGSSVVVFREEHPPPLLLPPFQTHTDTSGHKLFESDFILRKINARTIDNIVIRNE